ncbi:hypothetical protein ACHAWC_003808 [Mediolabrus comicus]
MIFRPLALAAAVAGSIVGLSSAEVSYIVQEGNVWASPVTSGTASVELGVDIQAGASKSLLLSLSSEIYLLTQTAAKDTNKGGKGTTATADAGVIATIKYCTGCNDVDAGDVCATADTKKVDEDGPTVFEASPKGGVIMSSREQELSVDVNLDCNVDSGATCEVTGYVEVGLKLETTAAQSFTWVAELKDTTGTGSNNNPIRALACFELNASADTETDESSSSSAVGLQDTVFIVSEAQPSMLRAALP